jgi:isopentenyl-diphosphate delta-isomerase
VKFMGKRLKLPLMITAVTGGVPNAKEINKVLAAVAEEKGIGFGLGSQRSMIEDPDMRETYYVRDVAPKTLVLGNLGVIQTKIYEPKQIEKAVADIKADGLCVHINPAQEMFQSKGDVDFRDCFSNLKKLCKSMKYPVVGKEVGNGISYETSVMLKKAGVKAIDIGGSGGTNWMLVEALRHGKRCNGFTDHGIPTAISVLETKRVGLPIIATGGVRDGLHIAKSIALGADITGMALPIIRVLDKLGPEGLSMYIDELQKELKMMMFLNGCDTIAELKNANYVLHGKVLDWARQRHLLNKRY